MTRRDLDNRFNLNTGDKIRVFTYLIGKDLKNADPLKTMACTRRGYFSHIASPADVKENVMQYYHVMNRQLAKTSSTAAQPRWSQESFLSIFRFIDMFGHCRTDDVSISPNRVCIKLSRKLDKVYNESRIGGKLVHDVIISSTVSVYHNPLDNTAEQKKLLGVVGADLPVSKLSDVFKPHELGPNGYAFLSKIFLMLFYT